MLLGNAKEKLGNHTVRKAEGVGNPIEKRFTQDNWRSSAKMLSNGLDSASMNDLLCCVYMGLEHRYGGGLFAPS